MGYGHCRKRINPLRGGPSVKTVLVVVGVAVGVWLLVRVGKAAAAGAPVATAVRRPTVPVDVLAAVARAEGRSNSGAGHF
jgi:hypothetical protein